MARQIKQGLDYFPLSVDFFTNQKIAIISAKFGLKGDSIMIRILCDIYRHGYYIEWDSDASILLARNIGEGCNEETVDSVVQELIKRKFFDKDLYNSYNILTSKNIQQRYLIAAYKRKEVYLIKEYIVCDLENKSNVIIESIAQKDDTTVINSDRNSIDVRTCTQRKVKERKGKQSKEKQSKPIVILKNDVSVPHKIDFERYKQAWNELSTLPKVMTLSDNRKKSIKTFELQFSFEQFKDGVEMANNSDFLTGKQGSWKCSFDWFINKNNFIKVQEGNYNNVAKTEMKANQSAKAPNFDQRVWDFDKIERLARAEFNKVEI